MVNPISNVEVFGLESSIVGSGYPMRVTNTHFAHEVEVLQREMANEDNFLEVWYDWKENKTPISDADLELAIKRFNRAVNLGTSAPGSGHDQYLSGITVNFDLSFTNKSWVEAERYKFLFFVSSMSLQHRATKFDLSSPLAFNPYVDTRIVDIIKEKVSEYNRLSSYKKTVDDVETKKKIDEQLTELYMQIIMSMPNGFIITARMTTNYRELKNIYNQRNTHRLQEWRDFCKQLRTLPYFDQLCLSE